MAVRDQVTIFVAPSERHPALKAIASKISNLPEQYGCDIIWRAHDEWWGIQRKEIKDFIASYIDGRLAKEVGQMRGNLSLPIVCIEGKINWSIEGHLMLSNYGQKVSRQQYHGMLFSLGYEGVTVMYSKDQEETADLALDLAHWSQKESHVGLQRRPGATANAVWGKASNRDWALHLLQGFPGIGPGVAADIIDHFGKVPLQWNVTVSELLKVPGIGPARAKALVEAFNGMD